VINFKIDMDIKGRANTLEKVEVKPVTAAFSGSSTRLNTMHIERSFIENEENGKLNWAANAASMFVVVNKDSVNPYGEYRGYRIAPGVGSSIHLTAQNSSTVGQTANWATHPLYVTKQKDTEPRSASELNTNNDNPYVNFNDFFDGESLVQEDM
jgi:primary-amine oxidase